MNKKDLLKQKAKKKLATSSKIETANAVVVATTSSELDKITYDIQSEIAELKDIHDWWKEKKLKAVQLNQSIIEKLILVRDNKLKLLGKRSFESYLNEDLGLTKGYVYEQIQAYNLCVEYKKPHLFNKVDTKVLVNIAREKDKTKQKELMKNATKLTRNDFLKNSRPDVTGTTVTINGGNLSIIVENVEVLNFLEKYLKKSGFNIQHLD